MQWIEPVIFKMRANSLKSLFGKLARAGAVIFFHGHILLLHAERDLNLVQKDNGENQIEDLGHQ